MKSLMNCGESGWYILKKGMKIADVDPRTDVYWRTVSDKARCIGGTALEAFLYLTNQIEVST